MSIPNVGVTGVIQDPGLGGVLAKGIGGITQLLQQQQEQARLQEQEAYRRKQIADQLKLQQDAAAEQLRGRQQVGQGLTDLMTPQSVTINTDAATGMPFGDSNVKMNRSLEAVMAQMDPEFRAQFLGAAQPIVQQREELAQIKRKDDAIKSVLANAPANLQMGLRTVIAGKMAGLPDGVVTAMYDTISSQLSPDTILSLKTQYPMFAELPQAEMIKQITEIKSFEAQRKLQLGPEYDRIVARGIAQAKLGIDRARLTLETKGKPDDLNSRQAALDIIKQVNDATQNDFTTFGQPLEQRVRSLLGEKYLQAWQNAQNFLIGQGMAIPQSGPVAQTTTAPMQTPSVLLTPRK